jgi:hypothetical protein
VKDTLLTAVEKAAAEKGNSYNDSDEDKVVVVEFSEALTAVVSCRMV